MNEIRLFEGRTGLNVELIKFPSAEDWMLCKQCALVTVGKNAKVGKPRSEAEGITVIGADNTVGDGEVIADNQMIYSE